MAELSLQRLLALGASLPNAALREEHKELVHKLAHELNVPSVVLRDASEPAADAVSEHSYKKTHRDEIGSGPSSAREKFQRQERQSQRDQQQQHQTSTIRRVRHGTLRSSPSQSTNGTGTADCDISSPEIKDAYVVHLSLFLV
jgi:hypothetical protein